MKLNDDSLVLSLMIYPKQSTDHWPVVELFGAQVDPRQEEVFTPLLQWFRARHQPRNCLKIVDIICH